MARTFRIPNADGSFTEQVENDDGSISTQQLKNITATPVEQRSTLGALKDAALQFTKGGVDSTKAETDAFGANNKVSQTLEGASDLIHSGLSDQAVAQEQINAQRSKNAEGKGALAELKATLNNFYDSPGAMIASGAGSIVPTAGAMIASKGKVNPKTTATALGAAQGAGAVKGSIHDAVKQNAINEGYSEDEAEAIADEAQSYTGENKAQIALGTGLGVVASRTGAESSNLLTGAANQATSKLRNTLKGFATEGVTEAAQGGQERVAANIALQNEGVDVPTYQGAAGQALEEGIAGGVVGGAFGAVDALTTPKTPREQLRDTLLEQEPNGPITNAAATAAMTGAADESIANAQLSNFDAQVAEVKNTLASRDAIRSMRANGLSGEFITNLLQTMQAAQNPELPLETRQQALERVQGTLNRLSVKNGDTLELPNYVGETSFVSPNGEVMDADTMQARTSEAEQRAFEERTGQNQNQEADALGLPSYAGETLITFPDGSSMTRAEAEQRYTEDELNAFELRTGLRTPGANNGKEDRTQTTEASTQGSEEAQDNFETSAGNIFSQSAGSVIRDTAATSAFGSGGAISDAGTSDNPVTYVIRNKETGDVSRETENPNEINYFNDSVELVEKPQHEQDLVDGMFAEPVPEGVTYDGAFEPNVNTQEADLLARTGVPNSIDQSANQAATSAINDLPEPTQAQKEAGNYKVGKVKLNGLDISIENPDQSTRSGVDPDGNAWQSTMTGHYGYVKGVIARAPDKEHVDVNIKPGTDESYSGEVYVINQNDPNTGKFDEPKVYVGYSSEQAARDAYMSNYEDGWQGLGSITPVSMGRFKKLLDRKDGFKKPIKPTIREAAAKRKAKQSEDKVTTREGVINEVYRQAQVAWTNIKVGDEQVPATISVNGKDTQFVLSKGKDDALNGRTVTDSIYGKVITDYEILPKELTQVKERLVNKGESDKEVDEFNELSGNSRKLQTSSNVNEDTPIASDDEYHIELAEREYSHSNRYGGRVSREHYVKSINDAYEELNKDLNNEQKAFLDDAFIDFKREYLKHDKQRLQGHSVVVSAHIAGRSNFNAKQAARRGNSGSNADEVFGKWFDSKVAELRAGLVKLEDENQKTKRAEAANKKENNKLLFAFVQQISAMATPGMTKSAFMPSAKKAWDALLAHDKQLAFDAIEKINNGFKKNGDTDTVKSTLGARSKLWKEIDQFITDYQSKKDIDNDNTTSQQDTPDRSTEATRDDRQDDGSSAEGEPKSPLTAYDNAMQAYEDGTATVEAYKKAFNDVINNEVAIKAELSKLTKAQLFERGGQALEMRYKSERKSRVVDGLYRDMITDFLLPGETGMTSFSASFGDDRYSDVKRQVDEITQESLDAAMQRLQESRAANKAKVQERLAGMKDPQTLDDYINVLRSKINDDGLSYKKAYMSLTPEQRARYDELSADNSIEQRASDAERNKPKITASQTTSDGEIIETTHTKKGHDLFVVQLADRVERDVYQQLNANAKRLGGYYSSYRAQGAVPGFQFTERSNAEAFLQLVKGDDTSANEALDQRKSVFEDNRSQTAVERLNTMADALTDKAEEALNADRKTNTHKRAEEAARAIANAESQKAMADTMRKIASGIGAGSIKYLKNLRQKIQIETLDGLLSSARWYHDKDKYDSYLEREKHKDEPATPEMVDYAEMPYLTLYRQDWGRFARELLEFDGLKKDGKKILDTVDDVSSEYKAFLKNNYMKAAKFTKKDGAFAVFTKKKEAALSIEKSGLAGKAIVHTVKRGEYMIVLSPSAAIQEGVWQGDNEQISFKKSFMEGVMKKAEAKGIELPWQLETSLARLNRLERMGIETPAEFRAALREYVSLKTTPKPPSKVAELERKMVGRRKDGLDFFPTPFATADEMIEAANIEEGMTVLEPSAGMGHIAERLRESGFEPSVIELSGDRRELLEAKGFEVVDTDFIGHDNKYDRIIMNPPFSDRRDMEHVRHAYNRLNKDGRLVAIMGEGVFFGSDKKATAFREWLEEVGGTSEQLPEGTFNDASLPVNTSVNARMVVVDKSVDEDAPLFKLDLSNNHNAKLKAAVQAQVDNITKGWRNAPEVIVVESMFDEAVPDSVRKENERLIDQGSEKVPHAFFHRNKVYLVASQMFNPKQIEQNIFHESLGHYGLNGFYGDSLEAILKQISNVRRKEVKAKAQEYGLDYDNESDRLTAAEEVLAELAQTRPEIGWVKKAIAAIRTWLRNNVPYFKNMKMTDSEIINNFILPAREFVEQGRTNDNTQNIGSLEPAFSRDEAMPETITVNGKQRPTTNSEGNPIHSTLEGVKNFWEWFDGNDERRRSQVDKANASSELNGGSDAGAYGRAARTKSHGISEDGTPRPYFHGTNVEFETFEVGHKDQKDKGWLGEGLYISDSEVAANIYANQKHELAKKHNPDSKPVVMPLYAAIHSPLYVTQQFKRKMSKATDSVRKEFTENLVKNGYDAVVVKLDSKADEIMVLNPNQLKSSENNNGGFSLDDDSVLFSRAADMSDFINQQAAKSDILDSALNAVKSKSSREFRHLKNIRTQYDKAQQDPNGFGRMFRAAQRFELDARLTAARPAEQAPNLLSADAEGFVESVKKVAHGDKTLKDKEAVSKFLFDGTLAGDGVLDGKVYTESQLRAMGANDAQIKLYQEARKAIDTSLDEMAAGLAFNMARKYVSSLKKDIISNPNNALETIVNALREQYKPMLDEIKAEKKLDKPDQAKIDQLDKDSQPLIELAGSVGKVFEHVNDLKKAGYAPLSRFGKYSLTAYDNNGNVVEFYRFETEFEAKQKERKLNKSTDYRVERGVMPTAPNTIFAGADPETVALFVEHLDGEGFDVDKQFMQEWYRTAVGDRSAMKRMIERKGIKGFDEDIERVLSSFITSNSRFAASNYNRANMLDVLEFLRSDPEYKRKGDVFDEARDLYDYVTEPKDPFTVGRSLMFTWFMGGSLASAAVNLTQPFAQTYPHLTRYASLGESATAITSAIAQAGRIVFRGHKPRGELGEKLKLAKEEGIVDPQETYYLYRKGSGSVMNRVNVGKDLQTRMSGIASLWGMMFSRAESLNRYITFIAAYKIAKQKGMDNAYEFAKTAVEETQGIYSKENRPNWARGTGSLGTVGAMAFTFKQYSIAYTEMLFRNAFKNGAAGKRAAMVQLGILYLMSGFVGMPFSDDGEDLIDTALQFAGQEGNSRKWLQDTVLEALGEDLGMFALYGVSSVMPFDISGRMGMGDLIPATDLMMPSNKRRRASSLAEIFGAPGSFMADTMESIQSLEEGKGLSEIVKQMAPNAVKNVFKAGDMLSDGYYSDTRGRRVIDTNPLDALIKGIGFQPNTVATAQKHTFNAMRSVDRVKQVESNIAALMAKARLEKDEQGYRDATQLLKDWNAANPDLPIKITLIQVANRVKQMRMSREERFLKITPKELRATIL